MSAPDQPMTSDKQTVVVLSDVLAWDKARGYRMPYRVRDPIYALLDALKAAPASPSLGERREEVARIIDPGAWKDRDLFVAEDGFEDRVSASFVAPSFAKADRIIALLSRPEGHQDGRGGG